MFNVLRINSIMTSALYWSNPSSWRNILVVFGGVGWNRIKSEHDSDSLNICGEWRETMNFPSILIIKCHFNTSFTFVLLNPEDRSFTVSFEGSATMKTFIPSELVLALVTRKLSVFPWSLKSMEQSRSRFHLMCIPLLSVGCSENTFQKHCPLEHLLYQGEQPLEYFHLILYHLDIMQSKV